MLNLIENVSQRHSLNSNLIYEAEVHVLALVPNTYFWYILAIDANAASINVIETEDKSNDSALPRPWLSHLRK